LSYCIKSIELIHQHRSQLNVRVSLAIRSASYKFISLTGMQSSKSSSKKSIVQNTRLVSRLENSRCSNHIYMEEKNIRQTATTVV